MGILYVPLAIFPLITENHNTCPEISRAFLPRRSLITSSLFAAENPATPIKVKPYQKCLFEAIDRFFRSLTNSSSSSSSIPSFIDPDHGVAGNYSPASELPPTSCDVVEGSLPSCLNGVYIQNGPNPQFVPRPPYHVVDGDGMLHSVKISRGGAIFCSRFVKTRKYMVERELGYNVFPNFFAYFNHLPVHTAFVAIAGVLTGLFNPFIDGIGPASTSLALIVGQLFALAETDLPYEIKITPEGDLITVGRHDFHSPKPFWNMTAHPKIDPDTGETFAYRYFVLHPFLTFFLIDSNGRKQRDVPIFSQTDGSYMHDFGLTKRFAIFPYTQVVTDVMEVLRGKPIMRVDGDKVPGLGFIPRYAQDDRDMWRIDVPGLNILHVVNAWEEEGEGENGERIVIVASNIKPVEHALERMDLVHLSLENIVIDAKKKRIVGRTAVSRTSLDFGAINPKYALKKTRYVYAAIISHMPKMIGLVKIDLSRCDYDSGDCTVACRLYGDGCYGSEPIFVPRNPEGPAATEEEDDGYLLSFATNEKTKESHLLVMDAKSKDLQIVAVVKLPQRVPHGFHAIFVREGDL